MAERGTSSIGSKVERATPVRKRTSIGLKHAPLNKHKRRAWKAYKGQGKP